MSMTREEAVAAVTEAQAAAGVDALPGRELHELHEVIFGSPPRRGVPIGAVARALMEAAAANAPAAPSGESTTPPAFVAAAEAGEAAAAAAAAAEAAAKRCAQGAAEKEAERDDSDGDDEGNGSDGGDEGDAPYYGSDVDALDLPPPPPATWGKRERRPVRLAGADWHGGAKKSDGSEPGGKARMKAAAGALGHEAFLQAELPRWDGEGRSNVFGSYRDWGAVAAALDAVPPADRHFYEMVRADRPCKGYLDIDGEGGALPSDCADMASLVAKTRTLVRRVYSEDYGVELAGPEVVVLVSPNPAKVSLHVVVSTHAPQWLFRSFRDASHLAERLRELGGAWFEGRLDGGRQKGGVDLAVYSRDRVMRLQGSTKFGAAAGTALRYPEGEGPQGGHCALDPDAVISWLDEGEDRRRFLAPPAGWAPHATKAAKAAKAAKTPAPRAGAGSAMSPGDGKASTSRPSVTEAGPAPWTGPPPSVDYVRALVACLGAETAASSRVSWLKPAYVLRREGTRLGDEDKFFAEWHAWSRKGVAKYTDEEDCRATWNTLVQDPNFTSFGMLVNMARADDPAGAAAAWEAEKLRTPRDGPEAPPNHAAAPESSRANISEVIRADLLVSLERRLAASVAEKFGRDTTSIYLTSGGLDIEDSASGARGHIGPDFTVTVDGEFAGTLVGPNVPVLLSLCGICKHINPSAKFTYTLESRELGRFKSDSPDVHDEVRTYNLFDEGALIHVSAGGREEVDYYGDLTRVDRIAHTGDLFEAMKLVLNETGL